MPTILVVDDEINLRSLYASELQDQGYRVITAASGYEALRLLDAEPDLVILDIKLEHDNGLEFLRRMKEVRPSLAVILNSGFSTYKDDFTSWLADAYLVKSGDTSELLSKVRELLEPRPVG